MPLSQAILATDAQTWKAGEWCFLNSGIVEVVVDTPKTTPYGILADAQASATSTTSVRLYPLMVGSRFLMSLYNSNSAAPVAYASTMRGVRYGVVGVSNVTYLDVYTTSGSLEVVCPASEVFELDDTRVDIDGSGTTAPGLVLVEFKGVL